MIVNLNPQYIVRLSLISGAAATLRDRLKFFKTELKNGRVAGDWDLTYRRDVQTDRDFDLYVAGKPSIYDWKSLVDSIKKNGYCQEEGDRCVEVALDRDGEPCLTDGRHRLVAAKYLGVPSIPVNIVYVHKDYDTTIPLMLYNALYKIWDKAVPVYQTYESIKPRFDFIAPHMPMFEGCNVLDIGCNSLVGAWSLIKYADKVKGVESSSHWYKLAKQTIKFFKWKTVTVQNKKLQDCDYSDIDALFASFVLYWLTDEEVQMLEEKILPQVKKVMIVTRLKERSRQLNSHFLNRQKSVNSLFERAGFKIKVYERALEKVDGHYVGGFSVLIGEK